MLFFFLCFFFFFERLCFCWFSLRLSRVGEICFLLKFLDVFEDFVLVGLGWKAVFFCCGGERFFPGGG